MAFDFEDEMRINNLARELLKSRGATSTADAYNKAKEILETSGQVKKEKKEEKPREEKTAENSEKQAADERGGKMSQELINFNKQILSDIGMIKDKLNEMVGEFNRISTELAAIKRQCAGMPKAVSAEIQEAGAVQLQHNKQAQQVQETGASAASMQQGQQTQAQQPAQRAEQTAQQQTQQQGEQGKGSFDSGKKSNHPRSGGYSSDDVALDKFFYYGDKKK